MTRALIIGASGQIGSELGMALAREHGVENVVLTDIVMPSAPSPQCFELLDVLDCKALHGAVTRHGTTEVYLLAALLSAAGERAPQRAWDLNMRGLTNVLEVARQHGLRVFWPSSIAVFGESTPKEHAPQVCATEPGTIYGISKLAGEGWCRWYRKQHGVDVRSLRYPGLISHGAPPGGGTTDYAVDIFHAALQGRAYPCYLQSDARLPMMYMPDAVRAAVELMRAPGERLLQAGAYNVAGVSFTPGELAEALRHHVPDLLVEYRPDYRQPIAASWPQSVDDTCARAEWSWAPRYGLAEIVADMVRHLSSSKAAPTHLPNPSLQSSPASCVS